MPPLRQAYPLLSQMSQVFLSPSHQQWRYRCAPRCLYEFSGTVLMFVWQACYCLIHPPAHVCEVSETAPERERPAGADCVHRAAVSF